MQPLVVMELIARQAPLREILEALGSQSRGQTAFFLPADGGWQLYPSPRLEPRSLKFLKDLDPGELCPGRTDAMLVRQLCSGLGEILGVLVVLRPVPESDDAVSTVCRLAEVAIEHHHLLQELRWKADHDATTGLINRNTFERVLKERLSRRPESAALLWINLDRFGRVNDVMGHSFGSKVLNCAGVRFRSCLPPDAVLARVGGDEFAILTGNGSAVAVAERLLASLGQALEVQGHQIFVSASIGFTRGRRSATPDSMQREAYTALRHAKTAARGRWAEFGETMAAHSPESLGIEQCLRLALANEEMQLYYQPQTDLATGRLTGAEALMRWSPGGVVTISPSAFIPVLEETGMIVEFGLWALGAACRQGVAWWRETGQWLRMSVNVSMVQLRRPDIAAQVGRILDETGFPPHCLELEVTESAFASDFSVARSAFSALQEKGVVLAIDDFGTGHSSLAWLRELPFQRLKIDQSFVAAIGDGSASITLLDNILGMARSLGLKTIAEGIETKAQYDTLNFLECEEGQGYFFSRPLPAGEFLKLLRGADSFSEKFAPHPGAYSSPDSLRLH